jgi:hypothetical protein
MKGSEPVRWAPLAEWGPIRRHEERVAILAALNRAGGTIERRGLQKRLWKIKAEQFNQAREFKRLVP